METEGKQRLNSTVSFKSTETKQLARQGIEKILPPKPTRRPLPSLLFPSFFYACESRAQAIQCMGELFSKKSHPFVSLTLSFERKNPPQDWEEKFVHPPRGKKREKFRSEPIFLDFKKTSGFVKTWSLATHELEKPCRSNLQSLLQVQYRMGVCT